MQSQFEEDAHRIRQRIMEMKELPADYRVTSGMVYGQQAMSAAPWIKRDAMIEREERKLSQLLEFIALETMA